MVIFNNSPFLIIIIEAFLPIDSDIIKIIFNTEKRYILDNKSKRLKRFGFQTIGYLFLLFGSLIINEIIIFNCCGLNKYTFKNINTRGVFECNNILNEIPLSEINDTSINEEIED